MAQRSIVLTSPYIRLLLKVLKEMVPDLNFYACIIPGDGSQPRTIYVFSAKPCGLVMGGYELQPCGTTGDIFEDAVTVTHFFLKVQAQQEVLYHPPSIQTMWEDTWIHSKLFQRVWAEEWDYSGAEVDSVNAWGFMLT
jgi:hypothetical protein